MPGHIGAKGIRKSSRSYRDEVESSESRSSILTRSWWGSDPNISVGPSDASPHLRRNIPVTMSTPMRVMTTMAVGNIHEKPDPGRGSSSTPVIMDEAAAEELLEGSGLGETSGVDEADGVGVGVAVVTVKDSDVRDSSCP